MRVVFRLLMVLISLLMVACMFNRAELPQPQPGKALLVMGFSTDLVEAYEGGQLYTGFNAIELDGKVLKPQLSKGSYLVIAPGLHTLRGQCFWKLRGIMPFQDDLLEAGTLTFTAEPGHKYTLSSEIDEYKYLCSLSLFETAW